MKEDGLSTDQLEWDFPRLMLPGVPRQEDREIRWVGAHALPRTLTACR